ncbi:carbohydrate ABC transporter permease [Saccharospirillum impatiens]|uniref:carbohydrate ABC transporter permease n=1 Tax=Saccharospirillum impatiens TaxID=169438 RepID=UPI0003F6CE7E|nr:carbohydrate ABC transporter permease [Saccharospirillum impatiens]
MTPSYRYQEKARMGLVHLALLGYTLIALFPIALVIINSFKSRSAIFNDPLALPDTTSFTLIGYTKVLQESDILLYFGNSLLVTVIPLFLVLLFGAMAAWALSEYRFRGSRLLALFLAMGIMVPIRLGTVSILETMVTLNLVNTHMALILVYTAMGLPLAIFILTEFIGQVPNELKEAARCDGISEIRLFFQIILPLVRPAVATVAVFTMVPMWNDLWFPLILAPGDATRTIQLGVQQFIGQYATDWNSVLAALSLAVLPILVLYVFFSQQLISGLTSGAVK